MNTIKQSQTMFARRVFELLASNTVVVSNFSRGVRLLFGDLVVSSDNRDQLAERMSLAVSEELHYRKLRLLGLRKVMKEHTYAQRLAYIRAKLTGQSFKAEGPMVVLFAQSTSAEEQQRLVSSFQRQQYENKQLYLVTSELNSASFVQGVVPYASVDEALEAVSRLPIETLIGCLHPDDFYGEHYLTDLALASTYSTALAFGKKTRYIVENGALALVGEARQYRQTSMLWWRSALVRLAVWQDAVKKRDKQENLAEQEVRCVEMFAIDEFNYVENGISLLASDRKIVTDLEVVDQGVSFGGYLAVIAESLPASLNEIETNSDLPQLDASALLNWIPAREGVSFSLDKNKLQIVSTLKPGQHAYLYSRNTRTREEMNLLLNSQFHLRGECAVSMRTVFEFQDKNGKKISHQMNAVGDKHALAIPAHCTKVRFGLRIEGPGIAAIESLVLGSNAERPAAVISKSPYLALAKQYPAYDDLYRYGFLHSRLRSYKSAGRVVDMFKIHSGPAGYREFENMDVATGDARLLDATLATGQIKHVLVHILDQNMWRVLEKYLDSIKVTVWAHGSEIQAWWRREFEFKNLTESEIERKKKLGENRNKFWRKIFEAPHENLHFVFVSRYFAEEVFQDLSIILPEDKYSIIHNPIDTDLFSYNKKESVKKRKILSIRPYTAHAYANDISVKAILELSEKPGFNEMEFRLVGDGDLFDETLLPLKGFSNIHIEKKFLTQKEIAELHKEYGVFLVPTRCDTQGVSRDEAMSSGLVPVTNAVAAVPDFVDEDCAVLAKKEDVGEMVEGILKLMNNDDYFQKLSISAARRVRRQSAREIIIKKEFDLF